MTTRQIPETIEDIYGFEVREGMVSDITDKLLPKIEEWRNRPLVREKWESQYPNSMTRWKDNWDAISPIFKFSKEAYFQAHRHC